MGIDYIIMSCKRKNIYLTVRMYFYEIRDFNNQIQDVLLVGSTLKHTYYIHTMFGTTVCIMLSQLHEPYHYETQKVE
jgi:hypothetical protein